MSIPIRTSIKAILINKNQQILMILTDTPNVTLEKGKNNGAFWDLVGGSIEKDESLEQALLREIYEESGIDKKHITLGPTFGYGQLNLVFSGKLKIQKFIYKVAYTDTDTVNLDQLKDEDKKVIKDIKWFSLDEVAKSNANIYPIDLKKYIKNILEKKYPNEPIKLENIR